MDKLLNIKTLLVDDSPRMQTSNRAAISSASDCQVCNLHVRQTNFAVTKTGLYLQCIVLTLSLGFFFTYRRYIVGFWFFFKLRNDDALWKKDTRHYL